MTRADTQNLNSAGRPWSPPRSAAVRWRVGSAAARTAFETPSDLVSIEFRVCETEDAWRGEVRLNAGDASTLLLREAAVEVRWTHDAERGLVHLDAASFLHATIDVSEGGTGLVYASTRVLGELGLGGGRYETAGVELELRAGRSVA